MPVRPALRELLRCGFGVKPGFFHRAVRSPGLAG